jgi:5-methyltetrahydropteroyltriglutamate--homocysteine methyltransferase
MSRLHAFYKMVSLVKGVNLVRKELGFETTVAPAALGRYDFLTPG